MEKSDLLQHFLEQGPKPSIAEHAATGIILGFVAKGAIESYRELREEGQGA